MTRTPVDILLVDDEPRNLDALEATLEDPAYRLLRAESAESALRTLLDHDVAAIVLDIKMPGVSGFELAQMIKNTRRFRETPIVFLTAYMVDDQDVIAGYGAGGVDYLTKPVNPTILRHKVAVFADLYRKTRELAAVNAELAGMNEKLEVRVRERTAELEKSEAALRAAAKQKDEFLAVLAHELRNPLAPMRTGLDLLLRYQPAPTPAVERTLAAMNRQLHHMVRLIDDLLDVSRISRGLLELKRERIDLTNLIKSTVDGARPWFERRKQVVSLEIPGELYAHADSTRVAQILTNLLHNAAKFTPEGGTIRVELARAGEHAALRVIDSGSGIRADQLDRVFDMFARVERPGVASESGLGIGLALARRLAEMHGGSLSVVSEGEGRGATFTLRIPALLAAPVEAATETEGAEAPARSTSLDIVVVEDNDDIADVLAEWLEQIGHAVRVARTGRRGVELVRELAPDVVVCDLGLPDLDGMEVCREVRRLPMERQPVMIALTGWGREDDMRSSRDAGFDHHLVKPVATDKLEALLGRVGEARDALGRPTPTKVGPSQRPSGTHA
jgi:signal transduction histidine kinase